jgi:hypothetical protein
MKTRFIPLIVIFSLASMFVDASLSIESAKYQGKGEALIINNDLPRA